MEKRDQPVGEEVVTRQHDERGRFITKLTPEVIEQMTTAIRAGASIDTASKYVGLHRASFHRWLAEGRNAMKQDPVPESMRMQIEFVEALDNALSEFKLNLTGSILQHGREQWTALAWLAERRFPDEFGRRQRIEHANPEGESFRVAPTPVFDPSRLTDEELNVVIDLLEKARPENAPRLPVIEHDQIRAATE